MPGCPSMRSDGSTASVPRPVTSGRTSTRGLEAFDVKRMKEQEHENSRLKRMYADLSLEKAALKDLIAKKALRPAER